MAHFTTDMVHYFKDWSIRGTQLTNWQDSLWVTASDPLQKFIPCNTKYLMEQVNCTNGILTLRSSSHCAQHIYHQAKLCPV